MIFLPAFLSLSASLSTPPANAPTLARPSAATQSRRPILRTALVQEVDQGFAAADTNKDGFADRAELEAAEMRTLQARKTTNLQGRERAFRQLDVNKDGQLTLQEFNAVASASPLPKADAAQTLTKFDGNRDGKISAAENRAIIIAQFDALDLDRDGVLSPVEQQAKR